MQNLVLLVGLPEDEYDITMKAVNMCMNRFCIDEDAAFELNGVYGMEMPSQTFNNMNAQMHSSKNVLIYPAFEKIVANGAEDLDIHFIYAGELIPSRLEPVIVEAMKFYKIKSVMMTDLWMWRENLITKEAMENFCNGKDEYRKESVNDDFETLLRDIIWMYSTWLRNNYFSSSAMTYFLPKLTKDELKLIENEDYDFMNTFYDGRNPDVSKAEMAASESDSKFVRGRCRRKTYTIENPDMWHF